MSPFQEGFTTFKREVDSKNRAFFLRKPTAFLSPKGHICFNNGATRLLAGPTREFLAIRMAYNSHTKVLALKPERTHVGFPETMKIVYVGGYRRSGVVSFKSLTDTLKFEFTGLRYPVVWNKRQGYAEIDLNQPMLPEEKPKRMRVRRNPKEAPIRTVV